MSETPKNPGHTSLRRRIARGAASATAVGAIFAFAIPAFADYRSIGDSLGALSMSEVLVLVGIAAFNLWTYLLLLTAVLPGLRYREAFVVNNSSTAVANTLPGGGALAVGITYSMYRSWGFRRSAIGLSVVVSGIWNNFVKLGLPIVALAILATTEGAGSALVAASASGVAVLGVAVLAFALMLRSDQAARQIGAISGRIVAAAAQLLRRPQPSSSWEDKASTFRSEVIDLVSSRWRRITVATVTSHLTLFAVLLTTLRLVGVDNGAVAWTTVLAAFAFGRLITAIPVTPGGLGVIELGYVSALSAGVDAATQTKVVAGVLLFRALTFLPPILIGACTYLFWRRNSSWRTDIGAHPSESKTPVKVRA